MRLDEAQRCAGEVAELLQPACDRLLVCGSVRRRKPEVGDIEIVAVPKRGNARPTFGEPATALPPLEALVANLVRWGELRRHPSNPKDGAKYKTFWHPRGRIGVDLFIAEPSNFGNLVAIRTGDADFSRLLVSPRENGGLMPARMRQRDGHLWRFTPGAHDWQSVPCWLEEDFFAALGLPTPAPDDRSVATVARLRREGAAA